ncbi:hypothetical protein OUZ56_002777 [Daphnia magna]|uniref:G-protein coupled receptors family 1 profile domain-containing protein n=1 Tax=Daphnia magna TaxID=35525 RepID=A0ABR0A6R9_9CRUS|nr:hypothetical protein OUZ56_002777 [Daphnia magna]
MALEWNDRNLTVVDSDLMFFDHSNYNWSHNNSILEDASQNDQFNLPWWRIVLWTMLFAVMVVISTGGNLIVVWIVLADRRMRTVTNYFLVNLSIADTMVSTLNVIFNFISMVTNDWPFGRIYCKISQFVAVISICGSVFTLMAISIERKLLLLSVLQTAKQLRSDELRVYGRFATSAKLSLNHNIGPLSRFESIRTFFPRLCCAIVGHTACGLCKVSPE